MTSFPLPYRRWGRGQGEGVAVQTAMPNLIDKGEQCRRPQRPLTVTASPRHLSPICDRGEEKSCAVDSCQLCQFSK